MFTRCGEADTGMSVGMGVGGRGAGTLMGAGGGAVA